MGRFAIQIPSVDIPIIGRDGASAKAIKMPDLSGGKTDNISARKAIEVYNQTGHLILPGCKIAPDSVIKMFSPKIGDTVWVSEKGIDWMVKNSSFKRNYWLCTSDQRKFTVTEFFSSGTRCKSVEGILPPNEFLTIISSSFQKSNTSLDVDRDIWANDILCVIQEAWPDIKQEQLVELKKQLLEQVQKENNLYMTLECNDYSPEIQLVHQDKVQEWVQDNLNEMEYEMIGCYTEKFWNAFFSKGFDPNMSFETWMELDDSKRGEIIGNTNMGISVMAETIVENGWVGETVSYYDGEQRYCNGYCIVRYN